MKQYLISFLAIVFVASTNCYSQEVKKGIELPQLTNQEELALHQAIENDTILKEWIKNTSNDAIQSYRQYKANLIHSDSTWMSNQKRLSNIEDFGYTEKFELIPLVENLYVNEELHKGYGVSYLIRTDHATILFDTGWDDDSLKSVFRQNLDMMDIAVNEIDAIVVSHNHGDHQNEWKWINDQTFLNAENENILPNIKIYIPEDIKNLNIGTICSYDPVKLFEGVYTTGIINAPMFFLSTQEQGLIFNIKDKGLVIVTGCGHQTVERLLQRCGILSDFKIYGILGGLHFPVAGDSEKYMGYFITDKLPWESFTIDDVYKKIDLLKELELELIGISTHDSSDKAIEAFKNSFPQKYKDLKTGEWIIVN